VHLGVGSSPRPAEIPSPLGALPAEGGLSLEVLRVNAYGSLRRAVQATRDAELLTLIAERDELRLKVAEMRALRGGRA
jgi:hypothetical protein